VEISPNFCLSTKVLPDSNNKFSNNTQPIYVAF